MSFMSLKEAAEYLGQTRGALQKMCQRKQIPHYKIAGRPRFKKSDLERWAERRYVPEVRRIRPSRAGTRKSA